MPPSQATMNERVRVHLADEYMFEATHLASVHLPTITTPMFTKPSQQNERKKVCN